MSGRFSDYGTARPSPRPGSPGRTSSTITHAFRGAGGGDPLVGGPSTRAASSRIGDALTDGLSGILAEAVEGPLQRVFTAIDERFDTMLTRIEDLEGQLEREKNGNRTLMAHNDKLMQRIDPLEEEVDRLRDESVKVKRQQENEAHTRQDELEGVNGVLKQMALAIDKIGDEASSYDQQGAVEALRRQVDGHAVIFDGMQSLIANRPH